MNFLCHICAQRQIDPRADGRLLNIRACFLRWLAQAQAQAEQLSKYLVGATLLHLMANRKGERTLVGFVK